MAKFLCSYLKVFYLQPRSLLAPINKFVRLSITEHIDKKDQQPSTMDKNPAKFAKPELDSLVRKLKLSKEKCVTLLTALKKKNLIDESIDVHVYDDREKEIQHFFDELENGTPYIKDLFGLFDWLNFDYDPSEWLLYIKYEASRKRMKCILTHKLKEYESLPFLLSNEIDNPYETLKQALEIADYKQHNWTIDGDFRAVSVR